MDKIEEWLDIEGYEGLYQASNKGKIRRITYTGKNRNSKYIVPKILKQKTTAKGYKSVCLSKNNKKRNFAVHRLIISSFLGKDDIRNQVNHKDGNKKNNFIGNLEWVTPSENIQHSYDNNLREPTRYWKGIKGKENPTSKPVIVMDKNGNPIFEFDSITQCRDWLRETVNAKASDAHISGCCKGRRITHCGYKFKYRRVDESE